MQRQMGEASFVDGWVEVRESVLDRIKGRVRWEELEAEMRGMYGSTRGRPSYPLLVLLRCVLLQQWYGLSDTGVEEAIADRLSFRRFVGLGLQDAVPDHTTLHRFRQQMAERGEAVFRRFGAQLETEGVIVKQGTMLDATLIPAARQEGGDPEARTGRGSRGYVHGYKAHLGVDAGSDLVREVIVTPAHIAETEVADALITGDEKKVLADAAYSTHERRKRLHQQGIIPAIVYRWHKHDRIRCPVMKAYNATVSRERARVERVFATLKQHMGFRRCRYLGLLKNTLHLHLLCLAYNMKACLRFPSAHPKTA